MELLAVCLQRNGHSSLKKVSSGLFPGNALRPRLDSYCMELLALSYQANIHLSPILVPSPASWQSPTTLHSCYIMELLAGPQGGTVTYHHTPIIDDPFLPYFHDVLRPRSLCVAALSTVAC